MVSTDQILLDLGRNKAANIQNSTSVAFVIDSQGPMKAFVGVENSDNSISQNSSLKLFFGSNSVNLTSGNEPSLNSIELPSGWKSIAAEIETDAIPFVGISLSSKVANNLFKM